MPEKTKDKYIETVGRRKTSVARARLFEASKNSMTVNKKDVDEYFPTAELQLVAREAVLKSEIPQKFNITIVVKGGGIASQAGAVRHSVARALIKIDPALKKKLKDLGFIKRDPRAKERRKFGLKKARKAPQWSKR